MPKMNLQQIMSSLHYGFPLAMQEGVQLAMNGECSTSEFQDRLGMALDECTSFERFLRAAQKAVRKQKGAKGAVLEQRIVRSLGSLNSPLPVNFYLHFQEKFNPQPKRLDWKDITILASSVLNAKGKARVPSIPATAAIH